MGMLATRKDVGDGQPSNQIRIRVDILHLSRGNGRHACAQPLGHPALLHVDSNLA